MGDRCNLAQVSLCQLPIVEHLPAVIGQQLNLTSLAGTADHLESEQLADSVPLVGRERLRAPESAEQQLEQLVRVIFDHPEQLLHAAIKLPIGVQSCVEVRDRKIIDAARLDLTGGGTPDQKPLAARREASRRQKAGTV